MGNNSSRAATRVTKYVARLVWLTITVVLCVAAVAWIRPRIQRSKQIQTYAVLQSMGHAVERLPKSELSRERIQRVISSETHGRDAWGNAVHVYLETRPYGISYVLVSNGSDGRSDVTRSTEYFRTMPSDIRKQTTRDIVFRDGRMITFAGK
jgi:hypothetical protein